MTTNRERPALLGGNKAVPEEIAPYLSVGAREAKAALEVLEHGVLSDFVGAPGPRFMGGERVLRFERAWAARFGVKHALSVSSATSGLHAAVVAAGVKAGDEVIVPPQTMSATATAVVMAGGAPVFVDQLEATCCIDVRAVAREIGTRTKAIIAVNLFGGPADVIALRALADERGLVLIEDNAQAPGGLQAGRALGTIGHLGVFSLNCHKAIQCGEGGVVVTNDDALARRIALVRNHGENVVEADGFRGDDDIVGFNYRLTELQAAIAEVQLERLEELTAPRLRVAAALDVALAPFAALRTARIGPADRHAYYTFPIWLDPARGLSRDVFVKAMQAEGLPVVGRYVRPLYRLPLFQNLIRTGGARIADEGCPVAERSWGETLLYTTLVQAPGGEDLVAPFAAAVEKIFAHADELASLP